MKISGLLAGCAAAALTLATPAMAQNGPSYYVEFGAGGGGFLPFLTNLQTDGNETPTSWSMPGPALTGRASIGMLLPRDVRVELSTVLTGGMGGLGVSGEGSGSTGVNAHTFSLMGNIWRDFAFGNNFTFHVGGGIGAGIVSVNFSNANPSSFVGPSASAMVGAGASYRFGNGMALTLDWRSTATAVFGGMRGSTVQIDTGDEDIWGNYGFLSSTVSVGLRIPLGN